MKRVNSFFFGEEHLGLHDTLWFYGGQAAMILFTTAVLFIGW